MRVLTIRDPAEVTNAPRSPSDSNEQTLDCRLAITWTELGQVRLDSDGRLEFPDAQNAPAVYRLRFTRPDGAEDHYIGESENLRRRFAHYRNPGPSQATNLRLNSDAIATLRAGGAIEVAAVLTDARLETGNWRHELTLQSVEIRRLLERAVLFETEGTEIGVLNKAR